MGEQEAFGKVLLGRLFSDCPGSTGVVDEDFIGQTEGQLSGVNHERNEQGVSPYVSSESLIFRRAAVLAASIHAGQGRETGGDYFDSHLRGTVDNLVNVCGRTSCAVLGAGFLHDAPEDHGVRGEYITKRLLNGLDLHHPEFKEVYRLVRRSANRIGVLVDAMHKIKRGTKEQTSISTLAKLLRSIRDIGVDVPQLRLADRLHNVSTLKGLEEDKQKRVARETDEIHVRLADILGMQPMRDVLNERSAAILNPDLYFGFQELQMKRQSGSLAAKLHEVFDDEAMAKYKLVDFPAYIPMPLANFSVPLNRPISEIRLAHLGVNAVTPIHEIEVIVEPDVDLRDISGFIVKNFAKKSDHPKRDDLFDRGLLLEIRSVRYGIIRFRMNNRNAEAKSKRGGCVESIADGETIQVDESGGRIRRTIDGIFKAAGSDEELVVQYARERLLQPSITVYTKDNEPIILQQGAVVADFAEKIHSDFLIGFNGARQLLRGSSKQLGFFDKLEDGMTIELNPHCLNGEQKESGGITIDPGLLLLVGHDAREALHEKSLCKYEHMGDAFAIAARGEAYILKIANLLGLEVKDIMDAIRNTHSQFESLYDDQIMWHVERGDIELLSTLNESLFKRMETSFAKPHNVFWEISVSLPDVPGALETFIANFGPEQINMENIQSTSVAPDGKVGVKITISDTSGKKSQFDMMKFLLKMSYSHSVRVDRFSITEEGFKLN